MSDIPPDPDAPRVVANPLPNPWLNPVATLQMAGVVTLAINLFLHSGVSALTITDSATALMTTRIDNTLGVGLYLAGLVAHAWNHRKTLPPGTPLPPAAVPQPAQKSA